MSRDLSGPPVALAWAPVPPPRLEPDHPSPGGEGLDQVTAPRGIRTEVGAPRPGSPAAYPSPQRIPPELRQQGLPLSPVPTVPREDRRELVDEEALALAVTLDILGTRLETLTSEPAVLHRTTEVLLGVGALAELGEDRARELLDLGESSEGARRRELAPRLGAPPGEPAPRPGPGAVIEAIRRVEAGATLVVRDGTLILQARAPVDFWQG